MVRTILLAAAFAGILLLLLPIGNAIASQEDDEFPVIPIPNKNMAYNSFTHQLTEIITPANALTLNKGDS